MNSKEKILKKIYFWKEGNAKTENEWENIWDQNGKHKWQRENPFLDYEFAESAIFCMKSIRDWIMRKDWRQANEAAAGK